MARRKRGATAGDEAAAGAARREFRICENRAPYFASSADRGAGGWRILERFRESRSRRVRIRRRQRRLAGICGREVGVLSGREFSEWQPLRLWRTGRGRGVSIRPLVRVFVAARDETSAALKSALDRKSTRLNSIT